MPLEEIAIQLHDLDDVRQVLGACLTYFTATDLAKAQADLVNHRPSPLTLEIDRLKQKFDSYLSDYLLSRHEAELAEDDAEVEDDELGAEEAAQEVSEASEEEEVEPLSSAPLGEPKRRGRRVNKTEEA